MPIMLKVRDVVEKGMTTVDFGATVAEAIKQRLKANVWSLVVQKGGSPEAW